MDYDLGGNGIAYYDMDTANYRTSGLSGVGNCGHIYRNDGVDIYKDSVKYNTWYVGEIENGEWLQYTINVLKNGIYKFKIIVVPGKQKGEISITSKARSLAKKVTIANTGMGEWQTITINNIRLSAGFNLYAIQVIR